MKDLLVIIDMINGFVNEGALHDKKIDKITPNIEKLINFANENSLDIVTFRDAHTLNSKEFEIFPVHCLKGSVESELIPQLKKYQHIFLDIEKDTTNGFDTNKFKMLISKNNYKRVLVCGCCTDICVENFANSLKDYLNKKNINTAVVVYEDACATFDSQSHNAIQCHNEAISRMQNKGIIIESVLCKSENVNEA